MKTKRATIVLLALNGALLSIMLLQFPSAEAYDAPGIACANH
jgi:hypothetical protein